MERVGKKHSMVLKIKKKFLEQFNLENFYFMICCCVCMYMCVYL